LVQVSREMPARGGELFVGEGDLRVAPDRPERACRGLDGGQSTEGGGVALGDGLEHAVRQSLFEVGQAAAKDRGDAGVGQQVLVYVRAAHDAHDGVVEGFGVVVVDVLAEQDHLAEDGARGDDRGGERAAVGGDPEDADPALLEDEQRLEGLGG
jgi:hypothetical protein